MRLKYPICELGPRSTGKSHLYKEISPNSILVSGGQTTVANLFYNMGRKTVGLVGLWDCVAFDEVAGIRFKDKDGIQIMKDYMASGSFARGKEEKAASASMVFVGNINQSVDVLLKTSSLFDPFPPEMGTDTAFLDRMHCYLPGWEIPKFRPEHFTDDYGFISDYLAEFIRELRKEQYGDALDKYFRLGKNLNQRDTIAVRKMVGGYVKLLYPDGNFTKDDLEEILKIALEMRRRVKEQLKKLGGMEFYDVNFSYIDNETFEEHYVSVPEQGGGKLIPDGICNPGQVYTVSQGKSGMIGVFRLESQMLPGNVEYVYTYYKWDVSLENIAADVKVTATYTRANRSNTVKFVMDGNVLETYVVPAHGSCYYHGEDLAKSGYIWTGWDQNTSDVIEDMVVNAVFIYPALPETVKDMTKYDFAYSDDPEDNAAYTFAEFYSIQKMGLTAEYLPIGSKCKFVPVWELTADTSIIFVLHSVGHYELSEGGMSHADWYMQGVLVEARQMNTTNVNNGGWDASALRQWLNEVFFKAMAPNWRNLIASSITLANAGNRSSNIVRSTDFLRVPSHAEVGFDVKAVPYVNEISPDAKEVTFSLYTDNNSRIKKTFNGSGAAQYWWLRSAEPGGAVAFRTVSNGGTAYNINASNRWSVCLGFSA